jgi:hypothetical protein
LFLARGLGSPPAHPDPYDRHQSVNRSHEFLD